MSKITKFEDIIAWQKATDFALKIYKVFSVNKDYSFKDQIQRAAISVSNNIAEGYERMGDKEFKKFLYIAKGSCAEVRSMLYIALELNYLTKIRFNELYYLSVEISKLLSGFIKTL